SKTTVYNTLQIMQKRGLVSIMSSIDNESRFEYNYDFHHHFICRNCGKIIDIYIDCNLKEKLIAEGHQVDEAHGSFYGVCRDCLKTIS
ncbi:MAG: transcriptional repressor, partial [bacterium]|nr:transcriptional repressor [bacterium]